MTVNFNNFKSVQASDVKLGKSKTDGADKTDNASSKKGVTAEDELQEVEISEDEQAEADNSINDANIELNKTKEKYNKKIEECNKQIETLQKKLTEIDNQIFSLNQQLGSGMADSSQLRSSMSQLASQKNSVYDNINSMYLNIMDLEDSLSDIENESHNAVSRLSSLGDYDVKKGQSGSKVIDMALKYDDKNSSQMASIMKDAGSRYDEGAWCADFVSHVLKETYGKDGVPGNFLNTCSNTAYCPTITSWAQSNGSWSKDTNGVQAGDLVLFDWDGDGTADHVGFYIEKNSDGTIGTIEGNTSGAAGSSCVETKKRAPSTILGYVKLSSLK